MKFAASLPALFLLAAFADPPSSIDGLPLGGLAPQSLPAKGCAAYLFSTGRTRTLAAVVGAEAGSLRVSLNGRVTDLARASQSAIGSGYGFATEATYRAGDVAATLQMTIVERADLRQGAGVPGALLRIDRPGADTLILPLAGMIGCRS